MTKEQSLVRVKKNRKGIRRIVNNVVELIKSKTNKDYVLMKDSPEFLKRNKDLILKTVKKNCAYLNEVPDDILLEELSQDSIPETGIINTAFKNGYAIFPGVSPTILFGPEAKAAILQYIEMQKGNPSKYDLFRDRETDCQERLSSILEYLDESLLLDVDFKKQLLGLAIEKNYRVKSNSRDYLKQNGTLAENYYRELMEDNTPLNSGWYALLSPELAKNKVFLQNYINMLSQKGVDKEAIVRILMENEECISVFKTDPETLQVVFEQIAPENLKDFFDNFFSEEEIKEFFNNQDRFSGRLLKLSQLYAKDAEVLETLNGKLLEEKYQNIPNYKMQIIAERPKFQTQILGLNDYEYSLYSRMEQVVSQRTDRWNRFESNIVDSLSKEYYKEIIMDLYECAKQGNKITTKDIEKLTFLLSQDSENGFNITSKKELEYFEEIKEVVCDTILTNPSLDDEELTKPIDKYLGIFKQLTELNRVKLALLEKYYNMDLDVADDIVEKFSADIDNVSISDECQASIVEQIKAIRNILECNDINILKQVSELDVLVETDLSLSTYLIEQTKEMYEQDYKTSLYMPKETNFIGTTTFNGKNIEIFDANTDFSMIVKKIGIDEEKFKENSQQIWNSMTKDVQGSKNLRYYTCCSYMTDENILKRKNDNDVILGFGQGVKDYSFDGMFPGDAQTPFTADKIFMEFQHSSYMIPSDLEMNTDNEYNEVVINTLGVDKQGQMTKLQPDYVVYIKSQGDADMNGMEDDSLWKKTKKIASEFEIPIVVVDTKKVREAEKAKIADMSTKLKEDEVLKFVKKVEHYASRYGMESILEYAPEKNMDSFREKIRIKELGSKKSFHLPNIDRTIINKQSTDNRQDILEKQSELIKENIITGEDR